MEAHDGEKQQHNFLSPVKKPEKLKLLSYEDLKLYTNNFSAENFIGEFQFGKVYRGFIDAQEVTVKIWEWEDCLYMPENNVYRMRDEVYLLNHPKFESHPNLVKLIGYCFGDDGGNHVGVVYDLKSLDNVRNLVLKDNLSWFQRIKVALGFAGLLRYFHAQDPPYLPHMLRNINAAHIMLDQDYNLKFYDFSMISGGIFPDKANYPFQKVHGCYGYADLDCCRGGKWTEDADVFAYGVVLLALISNRIVIERDEDPDSVFAYEWAKDEYKPRQSLWCFGHRECSLVHASLLEDPFFYPSDGRKITKLAMQCVEDQRWDRPTMDQVLKCLLKLRVVRRYAKALGIDQILHGHDAYEQKSH